MNQNDNSQSSDSIDHFLSEEEKKYLDKNIRSVSNSSSAPKKKQNKEKENIQTKSIQNDDSKLNQKNPIKQSPKINLVKKDPSKITNNANDNKR